MAHPSAQDLIPAQGRQRVRLFFCHLQKTGGTSLLRRFQRHFSADQVYPNHTDGDPVTRVISIRHLLNRWTARGDDILLVAGHFPLCTAELLGGDFRSFTILRHPVDRTLSYLRHRRRVSPDDRRTPLESLYEDPDQYHGLIHNHMVKMLSLSLDEMNRGVLTRLTFDRERLERAKARLASVDVVGIQERHEQFCQDLERTFGVQLGSAVRVNLTRPTTVPPAFAERIAADNALDLELYEFACELVRERQARRR